MRNQKIKTEAGEEQKKVTSGKIESQIFHSRSPQPPEVLLFHPFDSHLAVSCRDHFGCVASSNENFFYYFFYPS